MRFDITTAGLQGSFSQYNKHQVNDLKSCKKTRLISSLIAVLMQIIRKVVKRNPQSVLMNNRKIVRLSQVLFVLWSALFSIATFT